MKFKKNVYPVINNAIRILLLLIAAGMCLQSLFSTSFVGVVDWGDGFLQERTLNIADRPWKHLLLFAVFTAVGVLLYRMLPCLRTRMRGTKAAAGQRRLFAIGTMVILIMGTVWIFVTRLYPGSDPAKVYAIAMQWRKGDFSAYAEGGYLFRYPFQAGIILFYYLLSFVFGVDNYIGLQFVNVIALAVIYGLLVKLAAIFWPEDEKLPPLVYTALILWVPLSFYVTYLYGILPGMALSLGAVYFAAEYLTTRRYRYMIPAALCMGLATVVKMNCLIYLIAIACFLLYDAMDIALLTRKELGKQWIASLMCLALMGLGVIGCNSLSSRYVERLSGYEAGDGAAMASWVVMGLQETPLGPGGYSGYINEVLERYEYDTEKIRETSAADIKMILTRFRQDPLNEGLPFFARKNAFQWNDPTFISLDRTKGRKAAGRMPAYARSLIEGKGSVALSVFLNDAQTLLLAGFILYLILNRKSRNLYELMGAVVFLGGYLFHFFWEASASYTIPYFVMLIPYAVKGLADWVRWVDGAVCYVGKTIWQSKGRKRRSAGTALLPVIRKKRVWIPACALAAAVCVAAFFGRTNLFAGTIALNDGEDAAWQYYHRGENIAAADDVMEGLPAGYYYLSPCLSPDTALTVQDGELTFVSADSGVSNEGRPEGAVQNDGGKGAVVKAAEIKEIENRVLLQKESGGIYMRFRGNEQVLAVDYGKENAVLTTYLDDDMNMFYAPREDVSYHCKMHIAEGGGYYITIDDLALTYREGKVIPEKLVKSEEQRWILQR